MPTAWRASLSAEPRPILIAAFSGRALAAAARRAGDDVEVADLYADLDTARYARACWKLPGGARGFERDALIAAVERRAAAVRGLVYGAGFEHDPDLLAALAARLPLLGNPPDVVAAVKDPLRFAALLARLGLPHPPTTLTPPRVGAWLAKEAGGTGGTHIAPAEQMCAAPERYFQQHIPGRALAALFLADGHGASTLGFSEQWVDGDDGAPFRYGGCAGPARPEPPLASAIAEACSALAQALCLVGLNSLDLLVDGDTFHILEVNPRPGATLDIFDRGPGVPLWRLHLEGVAGRLPPVAECGGGARAAAVVYAPWDIAIPMGLSWPRWTADRGGAGTVVRRGEPICTVTAAAPSLAAARDVAARRARRLLDRLEAAKIAPTE